MKIGTLSMERKGGLNQPIGDARMKAIMNVVSQHKPDLLVCAGDYFQNEQEIKQFLHEEIFKECRTMVVADYKHGPLYLFDHGKCLRVLATQVIGTAKEARDQSNIESFITQLSNRTFSVGGVTCSCLCCGEINFFQGRKTVQPVGGDESIRKHFNSVQLIVNPTHDRMGNCGTLNAKRAYLSQKSNGRKRCYVSASNWDIQKKTVKGRYIKQTKNSNTLHTVYVSGEKTSMERVKLDCPFIEYREVMVNL